MTDPRTDELLSRVLDDEATAAERAQVQADPELQTRLQQMQAARAALAAPVAPLPPDLVDQLVARASEPAPAVAAAGPAPVIPLSRRRAVRAALSAAAVLLALALAVPVLRNLDTGTDTASDQASTSDDSTASEAAELAGPSGDAEANLGDLGSFDDLEAVTAALTGLPAAAEDTTDALGGETQEDAAATAPSTTAAGDGGGAALDEQTGDDSRVVGPGDDPVEVCRARLADLDPPLTGRAVAATMEWQGRAAVAFLVQASGSTDHVVVLSATTCEALAGPSPA